MNFIRRISQIFVFSKRFDRAKKSTETAIFPHQTYLKDKIIITLIFVIFIKQTSSKSERNVFLVVYFGAF